MSCICTVYRKDRAHPTREEVFFDEYNKGNDMWIQKPRTMLKKVAIVSAFRKAFPFDFGGMPYTSDELPDNMTGAAHGMTAEEFLRRFPLDLNDQQREAVLTVNGPEVS